MLCFIANLYILNEVFLLNCNHFFNKFIDSKLALNQLFLYKIFHYYLTVLWIILITIMLVSPVFSEILVFLVYNVGK
jgi:hypothetical protein